MQSVRVRLATFALVLAGAFGLGWIAGTAMPGGGTQPAPQPHQHSVTDHGPSSPTGG